MEKTGGQGETRLNGLKAHDKGNGFRAIGHRPSSRKKIVAAFS